MPISLDLALDDVIQAELGGSKGRGRGKGSGGGGQPVNGDDAPRKTTTWRVWGGKGKGRSSPAKATDEPEKKKQKTGGSKLDMTLEEVIENDDDVVAKGSGKKESWGSGAKGGRGGGEGYDQGDKWKSWKSEQASTYDTKAGGKSKGSGASAYGYDQSQSKSWTAPAKDRGSTGSQWNRSSVTWTDRGGRDGERDWSNKSGAWSGKRGDENGWAPAWHEHDNRGQESWDSSKSKWSDRRTDDYSSWKNYGGGGGGSSGGSGSGGGGAWQNWAPPARHIAERGSSAQYRSSWRYEEEAPPNRRSSWYADDDDEEEEDWHRPASSRVEHSRSAAAADYDRGDLPERRQAWRQVVARVAQPVQQTVRERAFAAAAAVGGLGRRQPAAGPPRQRRAQHDDELPPPSRAQLSAKRPRDEDTQRPKKVIKVTNIPRDLDPRDIKDAFEAETGKIVACEMEPGLAWLTFRNAEAAKKAVETFDRGELNGKTIQVVLLE